MVEIPNMSDEEITNMTIAIYNHCIYINYMVDVLEKLYDNMEVLLNDSKET